MATGRGNKIVGQTGEYLVAAELSRRGLIATTFTGNVPHYDIIASDQDGRHVLVQVKASCASKWQFDISRYCDIAFAERRQNICSMKPCPVLRLIVVLVKIADDGQDSFYILVWERLRDLLADHHKTYLEKHGGIRPKKWNSLHCAIEERILLPYQDAWDMVNKNLI